MQGAAFSGSCQFTVQCSISLHNLATLLHGPPTQAGLKHRASSGMCQLKSFKYHSVVVVVGSLGGKGRERWKINLASPNTVDWHSPWLAGGA